MAEQFLDDAQVRTPFEHVGGEGVSQRMRRGPLGQTGPTHQAVDAHAHGAGPQGATGGAQEEGVVSTAGQGQERTSGTEVGGQGVPSRCSQHAHPFLATLAQDADLTAAEVDVRQPRRRRSR